MSPRRAAVAAALPTLGLPGAAFAHSPVAGIEGFHSGLAHPATVPDQLLVIAALGILLGQGRRRLAAMARAAGHRRWVALVLSACGGLLVGLGPTPDAGPPGPTAITLAGSLAGADLGFLYVAGITGWLRDRATAHWMHVGLRVVAAWIAAIGHADGGPDGSLAGRGRRHIATVAKPSPHCHRS